MTPTDSGRTGAVWLGGIALLALLWGPEVRSTSRGTRVAVAREVLAPFGPVAVGAFLVAGVGTAVWALLQARATERAALPPAAA